MAVDEERAAEDDALEDRIRSIAREEVASLCGLVLRRVALLEQDDVDAGDGLVRLRTVEHVFGEALHDFGGTTTEPGT